jgi:hypothetical protein
MSFPEIIGANAMTLVGRSFRTSHARGIVAQTETHKGPISPADDFFSEKQLETIYDDVAYDKSHGIGVVTLTRTSDSATEASHSQWSLRGEPIYKDIRAHESLNQAADQVELELARLNFEEANGDYVPTADSAAEIFYNAVLRGQSQYLRFVPVLQKRVRLSSRSTVLASWAGAGEAWVILGIIEQMDEADETKKQWLKFAPQVDVVDVRNRIYDLVYEWQFARRWSETFYHGDAEADNP